MKKNDTGGGYGFGTFQGVYTPSILTIIGVVMYLRFGWMLGNVGLAASLVIVTVGSLKIGRASCRERVSACV